MILPASLKRPLAYKWQVTIAVTLGMFMSLMDMTIVNVAIPQMQRAFGADIHAVQWVVTIYMITQAAVIPTAPFLSALFGEKRAYLWSLIAFLLGSLLCGLAWNLPSLLIFRLIQGVGGGILLPMVMTLQYQAFPPEERGTASSAIGTPMMLATALGPVLGGYLVFSFGWQWAFLINAPLGVIAIALAYLLLRPATPRPRAQFDLPGFLTAAGGCAALLYAISALAGGDAALTNLVILGAGLALFLIFVRIEWGKAHRGREPLLDLRRFTDRTFAWSSLALVFFSCALFGLYFLVPIYLQNVRHETSAESGMIQTAQALATVLILPLGGRLSDRVGSRPIALIGLVTMFAATALTALLVTQTLLWMVVGILALLGSANGLAQQIPVSAMSRIAMEEHTEVANGSTLITVLRAVAAPVGVATVASVAQLQQQQATPVGPVEIGAQFGGMQALHASFLLAMLFAILALAAMYMTPKRRKPYQQRSSHSPVDSVEEETLLPAQGAALRL